MSQAVTRKGLRAILIISAVGIVVVAIFKHYVPYTFDHRQFENLAAVERYLPIGRALLAKDERFAKVELSVLTSHDGCLYVQGEVATERDIEDLKKLLKPTTPPVWIEYHLIALSWYTNGTHQNTP